jgi:hypothetical protein
MNSYSIPVLLAVGVLVSACDNQYPTYPTAEEKAEFQTWVDDNEPE